MYVSNSFRYDYRISATRFDRRGQGTPVSFARDFEGSFGWCTCHRSRLQILSRPRTFEAVPWAKPECAVSRARGGNEQHTDGAIRGQSGCPAVRKTLHCVRKVKKPTVRTRRLLHVPASLVTSLGRDLRTLLWLRGRVTYEFTGRLTRWPVQPCGYAPFEAYLAQLHPHTPHDRTGRAGPGDGR